jgi:hypothetical protein
MAGEVTHRMSREQRSVTSGSGSRWTVYGGPADHSGRCSICGRTIAQGAHAWLAHAQPFCGGCVDRRPVEVADRIEWARAARSRH